ncbi:MAG: SseB family protein [Pseudomonadota bacterium]
MTKETPIDAAFAIMEASDNDSDRLRFYERVADAELFVLLEEEPDDEDVRPRVFDLEEGTYVLAFDRADRLSAFAEGAVPYVALSGRILVQMLAERELGLGLNLEVAPSAYLLPPEALRWLADTLKQRPTDEELRIKELAAPGALPEMLLTALDAKLALMGAAAHAAFLARAVYEDDTQGHVLAFVDPAPGAEMALSQAASEALVFSGLDAGQLDVTFVRASDTVSAQLARVALRFDLPQPPQVREERPPPGSDPDNPPKLR